MHQDYQKFIQKLDGRFDDATRFDSKRFRVLLGAYIRKRIGLPGEKGNGEKQKEFAHLAMRLASLSPTIYGSLPRLITNLSAGTAKLKIAEAMYFLSLKIEGFEEICERLEKILNSDAESLWGGWAPLREFTFDQVVSGLYNREDPDRTSIANHKHSRREAHEQFAWNGVSHSNWRRYRQDRRRYVHPYDERNAPANLLPTGVTKEIETLLAKPAPAQVLLVGQIASGKSSSVEIITEGWLVADPDRRTVTTLPLAREFTNGRDWSAARAADAFIKVLDATDRYNARQHLFVIEDAHEGFTHGTPVWTGGLKRDYSNLRILITTRPEAEQNVAATLFQDWNIAATRIETRPIEIAAQLTKATLLPVDAAKRDAFLGLLPEMGNSLIAFAGALRSLQRRPMKEVTIDLAFEPIADELTRLCQGLTGEDVADFKLVTLTVWMLGGLEVTFGEYQLARLLHKTDISRLLQILEETEEVFQTEDRLFHAKRHPGWGLLVMKAIDEFKEFENLSRALRTLITAAIAPALGATAPQNALVALLLGVMQLKLQSVEELAFICSGRHMHDEFLQAATAFQSTATAKTLSVRERVQLFLGIASSGRRSNPGDPVQRQRLLRYGYELVGNSIVDIKNIENSAERDRLNGFALYERGYFELLRGELALAEQSFGESVVHEARNPATRIFGIMSASMQTIVLCYMRQTSKARNVFNSHVQALNAIAQENPVSLRTYRFGADFWYAGFELGLASKNVYEANEQLNRFLEWQAKSGFLLGRDMYDARILLLDGKFPDALVRARVAVKSREAQNHAETYTMAQRVLADALLGVGETEAAVTIYRSLIPSERGDFLGPEMLLIRDDRLARLEQGMLPHDILAQTHL